MDKSDTDPELPFDIEGITLPNWVTNEKFITLSVFYNHYNYL